MVDIIKSIIKNIIFLGLIIGIVIGAFCWAFMFLVNLSSNFLWHELPHIIKVNNFTITIILCSLGGLIIGLCQKYLGPYPKEMDEILHEYKLTKTIDYKPLPKYIICAFLPLIFGGSIGPEAGLFGMVAMLSTFLSEKFKSSIYKVQPISKKLLNYVTYSCTALSAYFAIKFLSDLTHKGSFIFKLSKNNISSKELMFFIPILILSIIIGISFNYMGDLVKYTCKKTKISLNPFTAAIIGGGILAVLGAYFPLTLFSGEHALREIVNNFDELGAIYLLFIAFLKILATKISINFRWVGGQIFPTIFASFCIAFAVSDILKIDPTYSVAIIAAGVITVVLRKPIIAVVLIGLFLPVTYWIFAIISSFSINFIIDKFKCKNLNKYLQHMLIKLKGMRSKDITSKNTPQSS